MDAVIERTIVELSQDEALVLFEAASKLADAEEVEAILDGAEQQRLHDLVADLERRVPAVLSPDYAGLLERAKARLSG